MLPYRPALCDTVTHRLLCLTLFLCSTGSFAAGFDCNAASTDVEKKICADTKLNFADRDLAEIYASDLQESADPEKLRAEQRTWLHKRDACLKKTPVCDEAEEIYSMRLIELRALSSDDNACERGNGPEMGSCYSGKLKVVDRELAAIIAEIKSGLDDPKQFLEAQSAWQDYRDKECPARATMRGSWGGAEVERCELEFTRSRIRDLRQFHSPR